MEPLKYENNLILQTALAVSCVLVGAILAIGFRHFGAAGLTHHLAGFLLGLLLLGIGLAAYGTRSRQTIEIDPGLRRIVIADATPTDFRQRAIPFADIVETSIGHLGKPSNFVNFYFIRLKLVDGETYALFAPGRCYAGSSQRSVMESRRAHLEALLKH